MIKEIKYNGYTAQPSEYICEDGDLSLSLGCIPDNGSLVPMLPPKVLLTLEGKEDVIYFHKTTRIKHYIVYSADTGSVKAINADDERETWNLGTLEGVTAMSSIGNTLVAIYTDGLFYWLWKDDAYHALGTHLPELPVTFGLQYDWVQGDKFEVEYGGHSLMYDSSQYDSPFCNPYDTTSSVGGASNDNYITARVLGQANKFISEQATGKGRFLYPFLVRYAFRMYDGSYTMTSAPVLMPCVTGCSPLPLVVDRSYNGNKDSHGYYEAWKCKITAPVFDLVYKVLDKDAIDRLKEWGDVIKSVDIFISKPVYTYDQNGTIKNNVPTTTIDWSVYGHDNAKTTGYVISKAKDRIDTYAADLPSSALANETKRAFLTPLPARTTDAVISDIRTTGNFYLLKSYRLDELQTELTKVDIEDDYLQSLVNRTQLPSDDYDSHDTIMPSSVFAYNQRLSLSGISKSLFEGFDPQCLTTYLTEGQVVKNIWVYIKQDEKDVIVKREASGTVYGPIIYMYYPNANAYKAVIEYYQYNEPWDRTEYYPNANVDKEVIEYYPYDDPWNRTVYAVYNLSEHGLLSGAYCFDGFNYPEYTSMAAPEETAKVVSQLSKVYTSQVSNPYFFPLSGINTVGTGEIRGICAAARPLSQGQFGQFPLYCFSTDGVWAMEVSNTGTYRAVQPISRDVCVNADSITQLDTSVLFVTDRGVMHIAGAETECLSDVLDTADPFDIQSLTKGKEIVNIYNKLSDRDISDDFAILPFRTFLDGCRIVYDYSHQHIIIANKSCTYAYVYSARSRSWGMMLLPDKISHGINSYPDALAMDDNHHLVSFSVYGDNTESYLLVTRPLKLDNPDILKTVDTVIQRGNMKDACQVLYGSRDLISWHLIWSSADRYLRGFAGTPYKYFRIAVIGSLSDGETLSGCTIQYYLRQTDQPR